MTCFSVESKLSSVKVVEARNTYLSDFAKACSLRGTAGDSNPRGGYAKSRLGKWSRPWGIG